MFEVQYASIDDISIWLSFDRHISKNELLLKVGNKRCYVLRADGMPIGVMRYNLFWDIWPFLTLIELEESAQGKGFGSKALLHWEAEMRSLGYTKVMTSSRADEEGQFFYRKCGYQDSGCLLLDSQPTEIFFIKNL